MEGKISFILKGKSHPHVDCCAALAMTHPSGLRINPIQVEKQKRRNEN